MNLFVVYCQRRVVYFRGGTNGGALPPSGPPPDPPLLHIFATREPETPDFGLFGPRQGNAGPCIQINVHAGQLVKIN